VRTLGCRQLAHAGQRSPLRCGRRKVARACDPRITSGTPVDQLVERRHPSASNIDSTSARKADVTLGELASHFSFPLAFRVSRLPAHERQARHDRPRRAPRMSTVSSAPSTTDSADASGTPVSGSSLLEGGREGAGCEPDRSCRGFGRASRSLATRGRQHPRVIESGRLSATSRDRARSLVDTPDADRVMPAAVSCTIPMSRRRRAHRRHPRPPGRGRRDEPAVRAPVASTHGNASGSENGKRVLRASHRPSSPRSSRCWRARMSSSTSLIDTGRFPR